MPVTGNDRNSAPRSNHSYEKFKQYWPTPHAHFLGGEYCPSQIENDVARETPVFTFRNLQTCFEIGSTPHVMRHCETGEIQMLAQADAKAIFLARPHRRTHDMTLAPIRPVEIPNPHFSTAEPAGFANPKTITATRRAVGIDGMRRGLLNDTQKRTAARFEAVFVAVHAGGLQSLDLSRDRVAVGRRDPVSVQRVNAARRLHEARAILGERAFRLVRAVVVEGRSLRELGGDRRTYDALISLVRWSLDDLAARWP